MAFATQLTWEVTPRVPVAGNLHRHPHASASRTAQQGRGMLPAAQQPALLRMHGETVTCALDACCCCCRPSIERGTIGVCSAGVRGPLRGTSRCLAKLACGRVPDAEARCQPSCPASEPGPEGRLRSTSQPSPAKLSKASKDSSCKSARRAGSGKQPAAVHRQVVLHLAEPPRHKALGPCPRCEVDQGSVQGR